jgi:hypothetical protein
MVDLDPLLAHLHLRSNGTWPTFARAVEAFDSTIDARVCARVLSEQSLVEFDFDGSRNWCVTSTRLVEYPNGTVGAWGGTVRGLPQEAVAFTPALREVRIGPIDAKYTHARTVSKVGEDWPPLFEPGRAKDIMWSVPAIRDVVEASPILDLTDRRTAADRGTERFRFRFEERGDPQTGERYQVLNGVWESANAISLRSEDLWRTPRDGYVVTRAGAARRVKSQIGLWSQLAIAVAQLKADRPIYFDRSELNVCAFPQLPLAYVRMLFLYGAREVRSDRYGRRAFINVGADLNGWLCEQLGYQPRFLGSDRAR